MSTPSVDSAYAEDCLAAARLLLPLALDSDRAWRSDLIGWLQQLIVVLEVDEEVSRGL